MVELLAETTPVARVAHRCEFCHRAIEPGIKYLNQRCVDNGTAWTFKAHLECDSAYWSWGVDRDDHIDLLDLTDGHLPPCWHATKHDLEYWSHTERFIGPPAPCTCEEMPDSYIRWVEERTWNRLFPGDCQTLTPLDG